MKRREAESIGDILRLALQENSMSSRLDECKAVELWPLIVGEEIARRCRRPGVANGVMTIGVGNAPLRQELTMNRSGLRQAINRQLGKEVITEIRFCS